MPPFTDKLAQLLEKIQRPGDFHAFGRIDIHPPHLEVEGVGTLGLPLLPVQAQQLVELAEPAPYGRGTETLVDTGVRRTWQVDAPRVRISGRRWAEDLQRMLAQVSEALGVAGTVEAQLYKLLVYDTGSFFVSHRDSEKAPGMFGTLVVVLPSDYQGGELRVWHKGREVSLDLRSEDPAEAAFAGFYADCRHEVLPIVSGYRLALIYNLIRTGPGALPSPPDYAREQSQVADLLRSWRPGHEVGMDPVKVVYPLEHAYTQAEVGFSTLKGADAAVAGVLAGAAAEADCDLHLALLTMEETGWAEYAGGSWRDPEFEIGEVDDHREILHDWCLPDGRRPALGELPFDYEEVSPSGALDDLCGAEADFSEATGNEGASFDRLYQSAALVLWPRSGRALVVSKAGLRASLPYLGDLVLQWQGAQGDERDRLYREATGLAAEIRAQWPNSQWERERASEAGQGAALLGALLTLGDPEGAAGFIADQTTAGAYGPADNAVLAQVLSRLPAARAADLLSAVIGANAPSRPSACADLLARCTEGPKARLNSLKGPALRLIASLPEGASHATGRPIERDPDMVTRLLSAMERIDADLAARSLQVLLDRPDLYPMDRVLVPAALSLHRSEATRAGASVAGLRRAVLSHLKARIDEPLEPPADWRRPAKVTCQCTACRELARFLAAPDQPVWQYKAKEASRRHVSESVSRHRCDLDLRTDERGRPYTLVCTKNQASYERRVRQRRQDLENLAALDS